MWFPTPHFSPTPNLLLHPSPMLNTLVCKHVYYRKRFILIYAPFTNHVHLFEKQIIINDILSIVDLPVFKV